MSLFWTHLGALCLIPTSFNPYTPWLRYYSWEAAARCQCVPGDMQQGVCVYVCLGGKRFRGKMHTVGCMRLSKPIQGRSGPSKQQFLHNDLLQWAWKLPQPAAFISHQPQQTAFCFILFFSNSLPVLLASIQEPPLSRLVAIQSLDWQVPSNQCEDLEAVGFLMSTLCFGHL